MSTLDLISPNDPIPQHENHLSLPLELQIMIYKLMIPPGRLIRLSFPQNPSYTVIDPSIPANIHDTAPAQIPVLFHICHTSRALAKETFVLGFGRNSSILDRDYWNPLRDTIYIPPFDPQEQDTMEHFYLYNVLLADRPSSAVLKQKLYQERIRGLRIRTLALDRIRHLALPFPDNSRNDMLIYNRDVFVTNRLLVPKAHIGDLTPYLQRPYSVGKLNFGADRVLLGGCRNLETLHFVGDDSMFTGDCRMSIPKIRMVDSDAPVEWKFLRQKFAHNWDSGIIVDLKVYKQFLRSFDSYLEAVKGIDSMFARWKTPELGVGILEFEKETVRDFCTLPTGKEDDGFEEEEEEESDYDSDWLSDDSIE